MIQAESYNMKWATLQEFQDLDKKIEVEYCELQFTRSLKGMKWSEFSHKTKGAELRKQMSTVVECYEIHTYRGGDSLIIQLSLTDEAQNEDYCLKINTGSSSMMNVAVILYRIFG